MIGNSELRPPGSEQRHQSSPSPPRREIGVEPKFIQRFSAGFKPCRRHTRKSRIPRAGGLSTPGKLPSRASRACRITSPAIPPPSAPVWQKESSRSHLPLCDAHKLQCLPGVLSYRGRGYRRDFAEGGNARRWKPYSACIRAIRFGRGGFDAAMRRPNGIIGRIDAILARWC